MTTDSLLSSHDSSAPSPVLSRGTEEQDLLRTFEAILTKKLGPSILVSDNGEMLNIFGGAERYLKSRGGRQSNRILDVIHESLREPLSTSLHHVVSESVAVRQLAAMFVDGIARSEATLPRATDTPNMIVGSGK